MRVVIIFTLLLIHRASFSKEKSPCINGDIKEYLYKSEKLENLFFKKFANHSLFYSEDSCGAKGCEIRIFTKVSPFCLRETLTIRGFYLNNSLSSSSLEIKSDGVIKKLNYFPSEMRFK